MPWKGRVRSHEHAVHCECTSPGAVQISAAASWPPARYARFGNLQIDFERQELYQEGRRVKVQAKIYQALLVLLGRAGEVVTREEVRKRLWPNAVRVNFDANVNTTMNKLRLVLGDSTGYPVYIETVPRRGYSFIAAVEFQDQPLPALSAKTDGAAPTEAEQSAGPRKIWSLSSLCIQPTPLRIGQFRAGGHARGRAAGSGMDFRLQQEPPYGGSW
jgi:DNA-binding winged helix-turn-helix (wHTH) protein